MSRVAIAKEKDRSPTSSTIQKPNFQNTNKKITTTEVVANSRQRTLQ
jgi:hypothetical protein